MLAMLGAVVIARVYGGVRRVARQRAADAAETAEEVTAAIDAAATRARAMAGSDGGNGGRSSINWEPMSERGRASSSAAARRSKSGKGAPDEAPRGSAVGKLALGAGAQRHAYRSTQALT